MTTIDKIYLVGFMAAGKTTAGRTVARATGLSSLDLTAPIAERMEGGYVQVGYNVLSQTASAMAITPYIRFEQVDTQARIPAGYLRDLTRDGEFTTVGLDFKPIPNVVLKGEYQRITNAAGSGRDQVNFNLGYSF